MIASGGNPAFAAMSGLLLGTRNTLYGLKVAPMVGWHGARRVAAAHLVIDESTAMTITRTTREHARAGFLATGLSVFVLWNLATLVGALAGDSLGDPRTYGLDAAVGAAFLGLLWPRLDTVRNRVAALLGAAVALSLVSGRARRRPGAGRHRRRPRDRPGHQGRRRARGGALVIWAAVLSCAVGCYLLKLAGMSVPERMLANPLVRRTADLLPVVLLAALVAVQVFVGKGPDGPVLTIDARLAGLVAAFVALMLRAPFIVVVFVAALTAALAPPLVRVTGSSGAPEMGPGRAESVGVVCKKGDGEPACPARAPRPGDPDLRGGTAIRTRRPRSMRWPPCCTGCCPRRRGREPR